MAKTTKLTLSLVRKVSDNNYGTFGAELTEEVELEEGDSRQKVLRRLNEKMSEDLDKIVSGLAPAEPKKSKKGK